MRCFYDLKSVIEKSRFRNSRIDLSNIGEQEKPYKQSAVMFETPDWMHKQINKLLTKSRLCFQNWPFTGKVLVFLFDIYRLTQCF